MKTCKGTTARGTRCRYIVGEGAEYCWTHDPDISVQERARKQRSRGAQTTNKKRSLRVTADVADTPGAPPATLEDAVRWASWAVLAVATGQIDARTAHEVGFLLRAFVDGKKHVDRTDERVRELTAKLKKLGEATAK